MVEISKTIEKNQEDIKSNKKETDKSNKLKSNKLKEKYKDCPIKET
jgi:hypothetical protein